LVNNQKLNIHLFIKCRSKSGVHIPRLVQMIKDLMHALIDKWVLCSTPHRLDHRW